MKSLLKIRVVVFVLILMSATAVTTYAQDASSLSESQLSFFEKKIRPTLVNHCYECHSQETDASGDLLLDSSEGLLRGGVSGPAVVPGNPERSLLIAAVRYHDSDFAMPPEDNGGKLPGSVISDLERWVKMGAPDPRQSENLETGTYNSESAKKWWSYQPVTSPSVPTTKDSDWPRTEIDHFILAALEEQELKPAGSADKASLLRRLFLDLNGLPPSPSFQEKFLASKDPKIVEKVVDWLLDQPQFGERWGRHWLDVARYAETTGRDLNLTMPEAWRYRDYVINAFNQDTPFDDFIVEQIAGDLLKSSNEEERVQKMIATGFLAVGPKGLNESDPRQFAVDLADEQIDAVTQAFMGVTVSCARCHDHKFDPISQADYTAMAGIFLSTETHYGTPGGVRARNASDLIEVSSKVGLDTLGRRMDPKLYAQKKAQLEAISQRRDEALRSKAPQRQGGQGGGMQRGNQRGGQGEMQRGGQQRGGQQRRRRGGPRGGRQGMQQGDAEVSGFDIVRMMTRAKQLEVELAAYDFNGAAKPMVMGVSDKPVRATSSRRGAGRSGRAIGGIGGPNTRGRTSSGFETIADSPLFLRGRIENEADKVKRGAPEFLSHGNKLQIKNGDSGRLELAKWIASENNTLTSRVIVNRVWHWLFGSGLVESVDNFGTSGTPPSNQQLLDYLADRFASDGWSIKKLIREIVLSRVYQLDSQHIDSNYAVDPDNRLFWRSNARRLEAESIRDCVLAASNQLDRDPVAGSLIARAGDGPLGGDRFQAVKEQDVSAASGNHRSIYLPIARSVQPEALAIFDFTDPNIVLGSRDTTIVPPQALYLMNGDFMEQQAKTMAKRVMKESGFDDRFALACKLTYCRTAYPEEIAAARKLGGNDLATWTSICRALLSSADFLFVN